MHETSSLKSLSYKALERLERNKQRNKIETKGLNLVSQPLSLETKNGVVLNPFSLDYSLIKEDYEERLAIAEVDGHQSPFQAERIAYQDAFISVLVTLPQEAYESPHGEDWLDARITAAKEWLQAQNLFQPK